MENPLDIIKSAEKKELTDEAKAVRDLILAFLKARKNLKLYPENNPIFIKTIDEIYKRATDVLATRESLTLRVTKNEILCSGELVYEGATKEDNLALFFFRDGLREICFMPGLEREELRKFLGIISVDLDRENAEDDLVTLLWQSDFQHITYKVDEALLLEDDTGYEEQATEQAQQGASTDENIKHAYEDASQEEDSVQTPYIVPITDDDLRYLATEIERDTEDKKPKVIDIIFGMLMRVSSLTELKDIAQILCNAIEYCMQQGDLAGVALIVKRSREYITRAQNDQIKGQLRTVISYASSQNIVRALGTLFESGAKVDERAFAEYVAVLEPSAVGPFMALLGEVRVPSVRDIIIKTLVRIGRDNVETIARGLKDKREAYVAATVQVLRSIGGRQAADALMRPPAHPDMRIRREFIRAIGEIGGQLAAGALIQYLDDPEPTVRSMAIKALALNGADTSRQVLVDKATDKKILSLEFDEMKLYFEALSRWKDERMLAALDGILKETNFFNRSKHFEQKACAAYALGLLGLPAAVPILEKYKDASNKVLSDYASIALRRYAGHGR